MTYTFMVYILLMYYIHVKDFFHVITITGTYAT